MNEETNKYICVLPTNGHQPGDEVFMTAKEAENANGGEAEPRFVLADEYAKREVAEAPQPQVHEVPAATGTQNPDVPQTEETVVVDQQMLNENPELKDAGVQVGDVGVVASPEESAKLDDQAGQQQ